MEASQLFGRASVAGHCSKDTCPATMSIYGYAPSWDFNFFFTINFFICAIIFYHQALFYPKWRTFSIVCVIGCIFEAAGYVGRLLLHKDPFSDFGFKLNIIFLTIAPAFLAAGIYLTLKHAIQTFGQHLSRIPPAWIAYIFVACDIVSIILQGAGGAISAIAKEKPLLNKSVNIMIAGLAFQILTLLIFLALVIEFFVNCKRNKARMNPGTLELAKTAKFQLFAAATMIAFLCIFVRCCYRVAEMAHGWGNSIMKEEAEFIILDSDMCTLSALIMNIFHPAIFFKSPDNVRLTDAPATNVTSEKPLPGVPAKQSNRFRSMAGVTEVEMQDDRGCPRCGRPRGNWV